ncbi:hypothetical protein [Neptuniibacter halophilus]|uniref:hypothetical protein n=1 Tax=Neptuniibacter halophilus TaxID=651666 RepID=UPI0025733490|nr:hypothetical protein [Neptuniibacter halophilus]
MKNMLLIGGVVGVLLVLIGLGGFFGFKFYSELAAYRELGPLQSMQNFSQENFDLQKENKRLKQDMAMIQSGFANYRKARLEQAEKRAERRVATAVASFTPLSGPYVLAATTTLDQQELCQDTQDLIELEAELFTTSDPTVVMQQDKICGTYIERKLIPLFKYQMLRARVSMSGSLGHLRDDAEKKFEDARSLLQRWQVPVAPELDSYTQF